MASDNKAHYARIGFTVVLGAALIVGTLIYLGGFHDSNSEYLVETYTDNSVSGLSVGSPVNLFGVKVGEVREITFSLGTYWDCGADTNDFGRVSIVMALDKRLLGWFEGGNAELFEIVRERTEKGLRATVTSNGITGLSRVDLKLTEDEPMPPLPAWKPRYPLIPPSPSLMDNFAVAATKLMNKLKKIDLAVVWSNVNRTADAAAQASESANAILEGSRTSVRQIMEDVREATTSVKELSNALKENPSLILRAADPEPLKETAR